MCMRSCLGPVVLDINGLELSSLDREILSHPKTGGLILFARNYHDPEQLSALVASVRAIRPDILICVDQEGGRVQRFKEQFTSLPPLQKIGLRYLESPEQGLHLARELGWLMAAEVTAHDVDISFAPVLDLDESGSIIIGDRSFSADADIATILAEAYIEGMAAAGMRATGKHFPGHGGVVEDSHLELPVDKRPMEELQRYDLLPYHKLLGQLGAVMPAHIVFPEVDDLPVGFSSRWLKDILTLQMGFDGVIFSDDLSMEGAAVMGDFTRRAEAALAAGCTSVLVCNQPKQAELVLEFLEARTNLHVDSKLETLRHKNCYQSVSQLMASQRWRDAQELISHF